MHEERVLPQPIHASFRLCRNIFDSNYRSNIRTFRVISALHCDMLTAVPAPVMRVRLSSGIDWATFSERLMAIWPLKLLLCRLSG
jgi:integral membrane sensor domain MASE1